MIPFRKYDLALATAMAAGIALSGCAGETPEAGEEELPEPTIVEEPDAISDEAIEEAVPGIEEVDTEGDTGSTAGVDSEEDAEYSEPDGEPRGPGS